MLDTILQQQGGDSYMSDGHSRRYFVVSERLSGKVTQETFLSRNAPSLKTNTAE